ISELHPRKQEKRKKREEWKNWYKRLARSRKAFGGRMFVEASLRLSRARWEFRVVIENLTNLLPEASTNKR
ncbi:Uncharacterized protein TCM_012576 isoform 2, partial [Theobroma cacao]